MATKVMTAPLGIIKVNGFPIGKMKSIRCTETIRRGTVKGIGTIYSSEAPALDWNGTLSCSAYTIDLRKEVIPGSLSRQVQTPQDWENLLLLSEDGVQIDIMRKVKKAITPGGLITVAYELFVSIKGAFATREGFDLSEGQISGRDVDFEYLTPFLFPI